MCSRAPMSETSCMLTIAEVADRLRCSADVVLSWIRSGELAATNVAATGSKRASWRISMDDLAEFSNSRRVNRPQPKRQRRKRAAVTTPRDYFTTN